MSKEERKDAITAKKIETKKTVRKAARQVKEAVTSPVEKAATGVKFAAQEAKMIREIEKSKGKAKTERKTAEKKEKATARKQAVRKPIEKAKAARLNIIFQSPMGGNVTPEQIAAKVPAGATDVYVRIDENKIYWVRKDETGSADIW